VAVRSQQQNGVRSLKKQMTTENLCKDQPYIGFRKIDAPIVTHKTVKSNYLVFIGTLCPLCGEFIFPFLHFAVSGIMRLSIMNPAVAFLV
jgi:hypothetical protein